MSFLQPWMLLALPLMMLPIIIHLMNQWRHQTKAWAAMMFLLQASRTDRGHARLRRWLILALRVLAIGGLVLAASRPLASGMIGWSLGQHADATIVVWDRSPSMQQTGRKGETKLETGRRSIAEALGKLRSSNVVLLESTTAERKSFATIDAMIDSPLMQGSSVTSDIPMMLLSAAESVQFDQSGSTDIWICSDMRSADWKPDDVNWSVLRQTVRQMPQSVRFHLVAFSDLSSTNVAVRVTEARRIRDASGTAVQISFQLLSTAANQSEKVVPVTIEVDGSSTQLDIVMKGGQTELRNHRIAVSERTQQGWGRVSIPADQNHADNDAYFVFNERPDRRVVIVGQSHEAIRALEIAAAVAPEVNLSTSVDVVDSKQFAYLTLDEVGLLIWQANLPDEATSEVLRAFADRGGQIIFFPPSTLRNRLAGSNTFMGVRWKEWKSDNKVMVEYWRMDQDLLASTRDGTGLPVGQLQISGYGRLEGDVTPLATLSGGDPLLVRVASEKGGIYFCTASPAAEYSSLEEDGVVLYAIVQRAMERGLASLSSSTQLVAGDASPSIGSWRRIAGNPASLSSEYAFQAGVYETSPVGNGAGQGRVLTAVNRSIAEDQSDVVGAAKIDQLFVGLDLTRIDESGGQIRGIVNEVWRVFLFAMIAALLLEALLCLPRSIRIGKTQSEIFASQRPMNRKGDAA